MRNHWLVGAMEDSKVDHTAEFVEGGYWRSFVGEKRKCDAERTLWERAEPGDRIGIKRRQGHAGQPIVVTTTGTIASVDAEARRLEVDWTEAEMANVVESNGCMATVCGPFGHEKRDWLARCFPEASEEADWADLLASSLADESHDAREDVHATPHGERVHDAR